MVRRQPHLPSFAGFTVFPGGKVETTDASGHTALPAVEGMAMTLLVTAAREVKEELGIDLDAEAEAGRVQGVQALGEATTPPGLPVRFRTHFLRVDLSAAPPAAVCDTGELATAEWASPAEWLRRYDAGRLLLAPPTLDTLRALVADPHCRRVEALADDGPADVPRLLEPLAGLKMILVASNTLPPATHTNAYLIGDSHRVLVDPSPANDAEYTRLCRLIDTLGCDEILLTHHHPDHRQYANQLAERYDVPLAMSDDTRKRIKALEPDYFGTLTLRTYSEGDVVTRWLGQPVRIVPVPGHDEGQLALMPDNRAWFLVGDLIQGIGTVVVSAPEGHMGRYFSTLEKVIALDPAVILPSHGQALGGVYRLQETLKHRRAREQAVLDLTRAGLSPDEMLPQLYAGVDQRLWPLSRRNIDSHLLKLREEGRL